LALSASLSFVHFSTSGLENSLAHLLATLFVCERLQNGREPTRACFAIAAGLFLTRFDFALLCAPSLCLISFKNGRRSLRMAWPALAAGSAWLLFATVYYGFPLPNTAYAKLNTGIPRSEQLAQGLAYLVDSACRDPIVLTTLGVAGLLVTLKGTPAVARALLVGVGAYVLYVVYLGGDFMSGRYLTTCYIISVLVAVHLAEPLHSWALPAAAAALVPFVTSGFSDRRADPVRTECSIPSSGIVDERECYVEHTGLAQNIRQSKWKTHGYLQEFENAASATPDRFLVFNLVGMASYANREERHIVERFALTEPLLARIRVKPEPTWRIGHFLRPLPDGYLETLRSGKNVIAPQCLHNLFDRLALVTHGPLWRTDRLAAILSLNITHPICNAP
jgi:arabinofuranosyltransferase